MAWYDSAGPAGAGFLKANQMFSEMNSREFENMLRQAQAQQLMQNMAQAPEEAALKREHQNYLMQELASRNQPKRMSPLDLLKIREQELVNQEKEAGLPFLAKGKQLDILKAQQETNPEFQLLKALQKEKVMKELGLEYPDSPQMPTMAQMPQFDEGSWLKGMNPWNWNWEGTGRNYDDPINKMTRVQRSLVKAKQPGSAKTLMDEFYRRQNAPNK